MTLVIRPLERPEEFQEAVEVQKSAWNMPDYREAAPAHLLRALADNGGLVLGAFIEGRLAGVSYGWPVGREYFYSHATGVASWVKYRGVGFALKMEQRRHVLEKYGLGLAKWTFDPLQALNSRFNLAKLGVIVRTYLVDYYGEIRDNINRGIGSDRAKGEWWLESRRVALKTGGDMLGDEDALERLERMGAPVVIRVEGSPPEPVEVRVTMGSTVALVPIPRSISYLREYDPTLPARWRRATREAYSQLIGAGYILVDSIRAGPLSLNVLWRESLNRVLAGLEPWRDPYKGR